MSGFGAELAKDFAKAQGMEVGEPVKVGHKKPTEDQSEPPANKPVVEPANQTPPKDEPPAGEPAKQPVVGDDELAKLFKAKYGIDLPDEQTLESIKNGGKAPGKKPEPQVVNFDPTEDEIIQDFEKSGKGRDAYIRAKELREMKDDYQLVRLHEKERLLSFDKDLTDAEIDDLLKESFFISEDEDTFSDVQKKLGAAKLKEAADAIRLREGDAIDGTASSIKNRKVAKAQIEAHHKEVDDFISGAPKKMVFEFGKVGERDLGTFEAEVLPETQAKIVAIMKNPASLAKLFEDPAGNVSLEKMYNLLLAAEMNRAASRQIAATFHSKGIEQAQAGLYNAPPVNGRPVVGNESENRKKEAQEHNQAKVSQHIGVSRGR